MPYCLMPTLDPVLVLVVVLVATNTPFGHDWRYQLPFLRAAIAFKYEFVLPVCGGGLCTGLEQVRGLAALLYIRNKHQLGR